MYENSKEFIKDIDMMSESLDKRSGIYLRKLKNLVLLAGFHLMQLDFRQHRDVFWRALTEIFALLGYTQGDFSLLPPKEHTEILNTSLNAPLLALNIL